MAPPMRTALSALGLALLCWGCGGSSSETPPPLEPDPTSSRYTGPRMPSPDDDRAPPAVTAENDAEPEAAPQKPGRSTWGTGKAAPGPVPAPSPAPTMTSPNARP